MVVVTVVVAVMVVALVVAAVVAVEVAVVVVTNYILICIRKFPPIKKQSTNLFIYLYFPTFPFHI